MKFHCYNGRVRLKASELRDTLKVKNYMVKPYVPYDVLAKRTPLYSVFEAEQAKGNRCNFALVKLYING